MSTFNGLLAEFPDIRIDFFRNHAHLRPPLACFLSHVHSDHLAGLETLRSPFVYCSQATKAILLRLERYPCRINYARGILETRQQTYRHIHKVLKPLPLETPTCLELRPGHKIQVTLFDANHCPGSVMFLIEGDGKAILYTGDIRSEAWFVNAIARNPSIIEYTLGPKTLDKIYLDTSFTSDVPFSTKAQGIAELLHKVSQYPPDTTFHFQAWTYGYEDVWIALSKYLKTPIHLDEYKLKIYQSLQINSSKNEFSPTFHLSPEAPALVGHMCGNSPHQGCLTSDINARLHSCERGNMCSVAKDPTVVKIQPIIAHLSNGSELLEAGIGGGGEDLERETELDVLTPEDLRSLLEKISGSLHFSELEESMMLQLISEVASNGRNLGLEVGSHDIELFSIEQVLKAVAKRSTRASTSESPADRETAADAPLPKTIRFPYSRHSSYHELCLLLEAFKPRDVWPCTVHIEEWLKDELSIRSLFGQHCSGTTFEHDLRMEAIKQARDDRNGTTASQTTNRDSQDTSYSRPRTESSPIRKSQDAVPTSVPDPPSSPTTPTGVSCIEAVAPAAKEIEREGTKNTPTPNTGRSKRTYEEFIVVDDDIEPEPNDQPESQRTEASFISGISTRDSTMRKEAYNKIVASLDDDDWSIPVLISTDGGHSVMEEELGRR